MLQAIVMRLIQYAAIAGVTWFLVSGGWKTIKDTTGKYFQQKETIHTLSEANKQNEQVLRDIQNQVTEVKKQTIDLGNFKNKVNSQVQDLQKKFTQDKSGSSRDFSSLAFAHPQLIENAINAGVNKEKQCVESVSAGDNVTCE